MDTDISISYNQSLFRSRTNNPLRRAYAMTIHKSQGKTLDKIVVDLGKKRDRLVLHLSHYRGSKIIKIF